MKTKTIKFKNKTISYETFTWGEYFEIFCVALFSCLIVISMLAGSSEVDKGMKEYIAKNISNKIVSVDMQSIVSDFLDRQKDKKLSSDDINNVATIFADNLESAIEKKATSEGLVIIPKQAVVAGGRDITLELKEELFKELS